MKYIRTKYGEKIIDVSKLKYIGEDENNYFFCKVYKSGEESKVVKFFAKKVIAKVADTIEELCDEFVDTSELRGTNTGGWLYDEFDSKNKCLVYYAEDERRTIPLNEFEDLSKIYGAIYTDKGLIYVAKMNSKGELELL